MTAKKPPSIKLATGTARVGREGKRHPPRLPGEPPMPPDLSPGERAHWIKFCRILDDRGQLGLDSGPMLRELVFVAALLDELRADIRKHGRTQKVLRTGGDRDDPSAWYEKARPQVAALQGACKLYVEFLREFGLTPRSAANVELGGEPDNSDDPAAEYGIC